MRLEVVLRPADRLEDRARPQRAPLDRQVEVAEDLLHEALLVVGVVDDEPRRQADRGAVRAQDPGAEGVEGAHLDLPPVVRADEGDDPLAHLAGGLVREGDGEDPPRGDVPDADEVGDAVGDDPRLARSGAGEDEERPLGRRDGAGLLGVEAGEDPRLQLRAVSGAGREAAVALRRPGVRAGRAPRLVVEDRRFGEGRLGWVGAGRLAGGREPGWRCGGRVGQGRFGLLEPGRGGIHVAIVPAAASPPLHGWRSGAGTTATGAASPMTLSRRGCRPARRSPRRAAAPRS